MVLSFLFYRVDKTPFSFHFYPPFLLLPHLCLYMCYTSLFLLCHFLLPPLSNSTPSCNSHTTYYMTAPYSGNFVLYSPESLSLYSCILYILPGLWLPTMLSTPSCSWLLLLEAAPFSHNTTLSSPILHVEMLPLLSFSHSLLDTPTSCVPSLHTWSIMASPPQLPASSPPLLHTASYDFSIL